MVSFAANPPAGILRSFAPIIAIATSDLVITQQGVTLVDAPGMLLPLEPFTTYALDGWISLDCPNTGMQLSLTPPPRSTGLWMPGSGFADSAGFNGRRGTLTAVFTISSATTIGCSPIGLITTETFGGGLQLLFKQITSSADTAAIRAGSWLRAMKIE